MKSIENAINSLKTEEKRLEDEIIKNFQYLLSEISRDGYDNVGNIMRNSDWIANMATQLSKTCKEYEGVAKATERVEFFATMNAD